MYEVYKAAKELQGKIDFVINGTHGSDNEVNEEQKVELYRIGAEVDSSVSWLEGAFGFGKGGDK